MKYIYIFIILLISHTLYAQYYPDYVLSKKDSSIYLVDQTNIYKYNLNSNQITTLEHSKKGMPIHSIYDVKMLISDDESKIIIGLPDKIIFVKKDNFSIDHQYISADELEYDFIKFQNYMTTLIDDTLFVVGDYDHNIKININDYSHDTFNPDNVKLVNAYDGTFYKPIQDNILERSIEYSKEGNLTLYDINENFISEVQIGQSQGFIRLHLGDKGNFILHDIKENKVSFFNFSNDEITKTKNDLLSKYGLREFDQQHNLIKVDLFDDKLIQLKSPYNHCATLPMLDRFLGTIVTITDLNSEIYETTSLENYDWRYYNVGENEDYEFYSNYSLKIKEKGKDYTYLEISEVDFAALVNNQLIYSRFNLINQIDLPSKELVRSFESETNVNNFFLTGNDLFFSNSAGLYHYENSPKFISASIPENIINKNNNFYLVNNQKIENNEVTINYYDSNYDLNQKIISVDDIEGTLIDISDDFNNLLIRENEINNYFSHNLVTNKTNHLSQKKALEPGGLYNVKYNKDLIIGQADAYSTDGSYIDRMYFYDIESGDYICLTKPVQGFSGRIDDNIYIMGCNFNISWKLCDEYYLYHSVVENLHENRKIVKIYDILGNSYELNSNLKQGMYLYIYKSKNGFETEKILINNNN